MNLQHGDCLDLLPKLADNSVDLIVTDPPYYVGMTHNSHKATFGDLQMLKPFFTQLFREWRRVLKDDGLVYCFTDWRTYPFIQPLLNAEIETRNLLVWDKLGRMTPNYSYRHELIMFAGNNRRKIYKPAIIQSPSFNNGARGFDGERVHPTQKPTRLLQELIADGSDEGDTVLDCFMGSGSTGVACLNTGRRFVGMELDDKYFQTASKRIADHRMQAEKGLVAVKE